MSRPTGSSGARAERRHVESNKEAPTIARPVRPNDRFLRDREVRLIGPDNTQLGIVPFEEAIARAQQVGLDLVEVARQADPPVCRIMDYGKFQYQESKKQRDARKKQHQHKLKEVKFHPNIDDHDYQTKLRHVLEFLEKGYKVKASMFFRGREMAHTEKGQAVMERLIEDTREYGTLESPLRRVGRSFQLYIAPAAKRK